jgi:hypothetical protein
MHRRSLVTPFIVAVASGLWACGSSDINSVHPDESGVIGSTPGWFNGDVVTFDYTQQFQCTNPPAAGSVSGCELGDTAQTIPPAKTAIPVLYVMTPLGFTPPDSTLHCPVAGSCVAHPHDIDVSRVFGPGTEKKPLPPHSHIVIDAMNHMTTPWKLEVIGVKDEATWDNIVATENLGQVRLLQLQDPEQVHITDDLETNIFLFFKVR